MQLKLAIIILNYKTPDLVLDCLVSLENEIAPGIKVIVVDNDSNDGSVDRIEADIASNRWRGWVSVLRSPLNGGFSAGNNLGIQSVEADAYLLLNSDTIIRTGAIKQLLHAQTLHPDAGLIGPSMEDEHGDRTESAFNLITPVTELVRSAQTGPISRILHRYDTRLEETDTPFQPGWIGFACVLIRREVIEQVGLLDENFFMYFEDIDYCRRVREAGWKILYWREARIVHLLGSSSGVTSREARMKRRPRYFYEARSRYFAKYYGAAGLWLANFMWIIGRAIAFIRQLFGAKHIKSPKCEACDIWINIIHPTRSPSQQEEG